MVNVNVNVSKALYDALLERKGRVHARTWGDYLKWTLHDPEGEIDFDILSVNGQSPASPVKITFRAGDFLYEYDPSQARGQQYKLLKVLPIGGRRFAQNH